MIRENTRVSLRRCRTVALVSLCGAAAVAISAGPAGCSNKSDPRPTPPSPPVIGGGDGGKVDPVKGPILAGDGAETALDRQRRALLDDLKRASRSPVRLTVDAKSATTLVMNLELPTDGGTRDPNKAAVVFLERYLPLIDPRLSIDEFQPSRALAACTGNTVVLDRVIDKRPVLGSRLTLQFDTAGAITSVVNGAAPVRGKVAAVPARRGKTLESVLPRGLKPDQARHVPIALPTPEGAMQHGELVVFPVPGERGGEVSYEGVVTTGGVVVGAPVDVNGPGQQPEQPQGAPRFHLDKRTGIPDYISYRPVGGVKVTAFPGEANAAEVVYRFLESHPALFRTGEPRCQFSVKSITSAPELPGVQWVKLQQRYAGLSVFGAELVFEVYDGDTIMSAAGHVLPFIALNPQPELSARGAVDAARKIMLRAVSQGARQNPRELIAQINGENPTPRLVVFPSVLADLPNAQTRLAYQLRLADAVYFIDAFNGSEVYSYSTMHGDTINDGLGRSQYLRPTFTTVEVDGIPTGAIPPNADIAACRAALTATRTFYASLSWAGLDNSGRDFVVNTNVGLLNFDTSSMCPNAFFDSGLTNEAYFCLGLASGDVVGHELTHGVISHSSDLVYRDESGALNESYADIMGNLITPDAIPAGSPPATLPAWLIGETTTMGTIRDMTTPGNFGDPAHMTQFLPRDGTCNLLPSSCDNGFVHSNSGINNRAHVLLSDGVPGLTTGITRPRLSSLAFFVMTRRLTPFARLNDAALATRDMCDTLVARGAAAIDGTTFTQADADQVPIAFGQVGLAPDLSSGWSEPQLGFTGTDVVFGSGETIESGCPVANVTGAVHTPSGALAIDLSPATATPAAVNYFGVMGVGFVVPPGAPPAPIGTTSKFHAVSWFNIFGERPTYSTQVVPTPPPAGAANCVTPAGALPVERLSAVVDRTGFIGILPGGATETIGNASSTMFPTCAIRKAEVEIVDDNNNVLAGPGNSCTYSWTVHVLGWPVNFNRRVTLNAQPPGTPNISAPVTWNTDVGQRIRFRLRYYIDQPVGTTCTP